MKMVAGSVVAALAASVCCLGPVVAAAIGAGALGAASTQFEPYRPWLLGLTALLLGAAFATTYRRTRACADRGCAPSARPAGRIVLWIAVVLVGLLTAFPYYADWLVREEVGGPAQVVSPQARVVTLNVPEMDCAGCEVGVRVAAGKVDGVTEVKTSSDTRTAEVSFDALKTNAEAIGNAITRGTGFKTSPGLLP
jgi:copper chaperone CopZ